MEVRFWKRLREEKNSPAPKNSAPKSPRDIASARPLSSPASAAIVRSETHRFPRRTLSPMRWRVFPGFVVAGL